MYIAIIGDIRDSKKIQDRFTIARRLSDANYLVYLDTLELIKKEMERLMQLYD